MANAAASYKLLASSISTVCRMPSESTNETTERAMRESVAQHAYQWNSVAYTGHACEACRATLTFRSAGRRRIAPGALVLTLLTKVINDPTEVFYALDKIVQSYVFIRAVGV